jgi:lysophospholipase L1-like esterase
MAHYKPNTQKKIVFHGNSLFHLSANNLFYGNAVSNYVRSGLTTAGNKAPVFDYSFQGKTTRQLTTEFPTVVVPYFKSGDILIHWELTNDLNSGQTPAQCLANEIAFCQQAKAIGMKVYILTCIPRNPTFISDASRLALNALILADTSFCDGVVDVTLMTEFSLATSYLNTTFYNADGTHLTTTGYNLIGQKILDSVNFN